jgi:serine/threonine protein kinase
MENRNLSTLRDALSINQRIVRFLATVSIGEDCFIISPLADMSLHKFLYDEGSREFTTSMVNLITEASNLADALDFLHAHIRIEVPGKSSQLLACCHMDLKPDNILVFRRPDKAVGIWMITDFGISTLKENTSSQAKGKNQLEVPTTVGMIAQTTKTGAKREKGTFQAPEVNEIDVENFRSVGRKSDIWSFGCILVLLIVFGSDGLKELKEHDRKRLQGSFTPNDEGSNDFFYSKSDESSQLIVNPAVKGFIDDLAGYGSLRNDNIKFDYKKCSKLLLQILNPTNPQKRPDAKVIHEELNSIVSPPSKQNSSSSTQGAGHKGKGKARSGSTSSNAESLDHVRSHSSQSGERSVRPTPFEENKKPDLSSSVSRSRASSSRSDQSLTLAHNMGRTSHESTPLRNESTPNTPRLTFSPPIGPTLGHAKRPSGSGSLTRIIEDQLPETPNPTEQSRWPEHFGAIQIQPPQHAPPTPPDEPAIASSSVQNQNFVTSMPNTQEAKIDPFRLTTAKNPKGVFLSSSGDRVALLYENEVHVHLLEGIRRNFQIPKLVRSDFKEWTSACHAGNYLCLKGVYGKRQDLVRWTKKIEKMY